MITIYNEQLDYLSEICEGDTIEMSKLLNWYTNNYSMSKNESELLTGYKKLIFEQFKRIEETLLTGEQNGKTWINR